MITDPDGLALMPLSFFSAWPEPHTELPANAAAANHELINVGVWGYQLHLFHGWVQERWGDEVQRNVKQAQMLILENNRAGGLDKVLNIIETAIIHGMLEIEHLAGTDGDRNSAIDLIVALALLERSAGTDGHQEPGSSISEYQLIDCLSRGRGRMETAIQPLFAILKLADGRQ